MSAPAIHLARPECDDAQANECLLLSKITVPSLPAWTVSRRRIEKLISDAAQKPLTLVAGPAGAGKTIALASWCGSTAGPVAWISVDCYDNRPQLFWSYLVASLRRADVAAAGPGRAGWSRDSMDHGFLLRLASVLAVQDPPVVLVLDDLHVLTNRRLLDDLSYVLQHARAGLRLVLASRTYAPAPLRRLLLAGDLAEVPAADLAFTVPEAGRLLAQHDVTLSPAALEILTRRTEGWAAGLRLSALAMRSHPDPDQFAMDFGPEDSAILGYLAGEVLDAQPARVRNLLMKTSILNRVNDDLADELTGDRQAAGMLPALAEANAFIQPLGHGWYRYHSVFAEVLRLMLRREAGYEVGELRRRATRWLRRNGRLADAVSQAAAATDWPLAARTVIDELAVARLMDPRTAGPLADEVRRLPTDPASDPPPSLLAAAAVAVRDRRPDAARHLLRVADGMLDRLPAEEEVTSRLAAAQIRLALARQSGDLDLAAAAVAEGERLLAAIPDDQLTSHPEARVWLLVGRGVVELWKGHFGTAADLIDAAAAAGADASERADCAGLSALLEAVQGRLGHGAELASAVLPSEGSCAASSRSSAAAEIALAWVHLEHAQLDDTRGQLAQAQNTLRSHPDKLIAALAYLVAARHSLAIGRPDPAAEMTGRARRGWSPPAWLDHLLTLAESHAHARAGKTTAAIENAQRAQPGATSDAAVALARAWLSSGNPEAASQALAPFAATNAQAVPERVGVEACLVKARLRHSAGDSAGVRRALEQALRLAEPEQLRLPFRLEWAWLEPVLRNDPGLAHAFRRLFDPAGATPRRGIPGLGVPGSGRAAAGRTRPGRAAAGPQGAGPSAP
jgi:LuxR family transcriptional regulator, maltose regulon positive regulatory protein